MGSRNRNVVHSDGADTDVRNQEVLRANRELAAYFKGKRTEREARAALKTIKAFVRDRERIDGKLGPPLPVMKSMNVDKRATNRNVSPAESHDHPSKQ